jgi:16S rRNA U516 pseudouridylate synthase RsuA-like enzyme
VNFHFQLQINEMQVEKVLSQKGALSRKEIKELMSRGVNGITDG